MKGSGNDGRHGRRQSPWRRRLVLLLLLALPAAAQEGRYDGVARIVAFGDVHGAYDELLSVLRSTGTIDAAGRWAAGTGHAVSLGDLLDRGADSRRVMDLLMRLQTEARAAGGRLHVVLGNHEIMNLTGDLRYVAPGEYAAFAGEESAGTRERAYAAYLAGHPAGDADETAARASFERRFPPGYFAHRAAFAADGTYGRWLLAQPMLVVVNGTAFVHGGLPPVTARMTAAEINRQLHAELTELLALGNRLTAAGWLTGHADLLAAGTELEARLAAANPAPETVAADARRLVALAGSPLFGAQSPNWYRGTARCHELLEQPLLDAALARLGASRVVVGHTVTASRRVQSRFDGAVLMADTGMLAGAYRGQPAAVVLEGAGARAVYAAGGTAEPVAVPEPAHQGFTVTELERVLLEAEAAVPSEAYADGSMMITLRSDNKAVHALFRPGRRGATERELAAYALSRHLELGLVPVTVARRIAGRDGALTALPPGAISERTRVERGLPRSNWCAMGNDYQLMYAFDALINNPARTTDTMFYDPEDWQLYLTGHGAGFERGRRLPAYLEAVDKVLPAALRAALERLDEAALHELVGARLARGVLDRRDVLLGTWSTP